MTPLSKVLTRACAEDAADLARARLTAPGMRHPSRPCELATRLLLRAFRDPDFCARLAEVGKPRRQEARHCCPRQHR